MASKDILRLGCGAGFSSDRLEPAIDLARDGRLDYLVFETIGERTLAFGHRDRKLDPKRGYNPQLAARMRGVLRHCRDNKTRIVTNMGVANVVAAAEVVVGIARELGLHGLKVACVEGDDVTSMLTPGTVLFDHGNRTIAEVGRPVVGANVYLGIDAILPALETGADVVITGRVADPSLFLSPLVHHFGWAQDDWTLMGRGTLVGHLMECGMQITGGYFADPGFKDVPRPADCGYPIAEASADSNVVITKLATAGGVVSSRTVKEQLLYEVHDPAAYLTPDVAADISEATVTELGSDRVRLDGVRGHARPTHLKVNLCHESGWLAEGEISYAGARAEARARLAADTLRKRLAGLALRVDLIGAVSILGDDTGRRLAATPEGGARDVRLRVAATHEDRAEAERLAREVMALYTCGPAGGGGVRTALTPRLNTISCLLPREAVPVRFEIVEEGQA